MMVLFTSDHLNWHTYGRGFIVSPVTRSNRKLVVVKFGFNYFNPPAMTSRSRAAPYCVKLCTAHDSILSGWEMYSHFYWVIITV